MATSIGIRGIVAMLLAAVTAAASAQDSTFRITQLFSSLDGEFQLIELTESAGLNGQHHLKGLNLTSTHNGVVKRFTFPRDLATDQTAHMSIIVSSTGNVPLAGIIQDYWVEVWGLPSRFIPTEGGTLDFAGVDRMTYASLPTDGASALYRDGSVREATVPANGRCYRSCEPRYKVDERIYAFAIEFHHAALDHYFISASAADIEALDGGRFNGWKRTGQGFPVGARAISELDRPVCRFYIPPDQGNSHFYSASTEECEVVRARFPNFILESLAAFYVEVPDRVTGSCPPDEGSGVYAVPVYRLWNQRSDSNHRYTSSASIRDEMLRRGYVSEGVFMCFWTSVWDY